MKKYFNFPLLIAVLAFTSFGVASCGDDDDKEVTLTEKEKELQEINESYLKEVILPVYKSLSDESLKLQNALVALQNDKTDANLNKACEYWFSARRYWEWSEAFLYGPADDYHIDPHIDTWPTDIPEVESIVRDESKLNDIQTYIYDNEGGLAGFHGLEYIFFREGVKRPVSQLTTNELRFAVGVAKDLAMSCFRLESAWAGNENISKEKQYVLKEYGITDDDDDYGNRMINGYDREGNVLGSTAQIIEGFWTIIDEVGAGKIGTAYNGIDVDYIESPHAHNSLQDFEDNILGVRSGYFGAMSAASAKDKSIAAYLKKINPDLDREILGAFDNCIAKIREIPKPFAQNYTSPKCLAAIEACETLYDLFLEAENAIKQD
jgi:hypothetical protein